MKGKEIFNFKSKYRASLMETRNKSGYLWSNINNVHSKTQLK